MIKGAQKQMIVLRTGNSRYFDEAYFVLRKDVKSKNSNKTDMLREATRILEESEFHPASARKRAHTWLFFLFGILLGAAIGGLLIYLIF